MKKSIRSNFLALVLLIVLFSGCAPVPAPTPTLAPPTFTPSPIPATFTPVPTATATSIPSPTPLPGSVVLPVDTLGKNIPWLPLDKTARPAVNYVVFNTLIPPFNSPLVRQAFASAIDRDILVEMATKYKSQNAKHATTFTPPETLGRDLYGEVGTGFDPKMAKDLLTQAGYTDTSVFPPVVFLVNAYGDTAPGARFNIASAMADMWQTNLGVTVEVQVVAKFKDYGSRIKTNPPELFWMGWVAESNDPDNFLQEVFHSSSQYNYGKFSNSEFDKLVDRAATSNDPAKRQELYIQAERILSETEAAMLPIFHSTYNIP